MLNSLFTVPKCLTILAVVWVGQAHLPNGIYLRHLQIAPKTIAIYICILNYKRNPSVTSRGKYGKQNKEMKIYLYHIP